MTKSDKLVINESITVNYINGIIKIQGDTINASVFISQSALGSIYMGQEGSGTIQLIVDVEVLETDSDDSNQT